MENQVVIACKNVKFYAPPDEDIFFNWARNIKSIKDIKGKGDQILLFFANKNIDLEELGSLIALFRRYRINTKKLELFLNEDNEQFFYNCKNGFSVNIYPNIQN